MPPLMVNSSVCRAVRRLSVYRLPSAARTSPCLIRMYVPGGPSILIRSQPVRFWPKSTICRPWSSVAMLRGVISWVTRTGGPGSATSGVLSRFLACTRRQSLALKPGTSQPVGSSARSCRSPINRSACRIAPIEDSHCLSVTIRCSLPSANCSTSWASSSGAVP